MGPRHDTRRVTTTGGDHLGGRAWLAARHAERLYPGTLGRLVAHELTAYAEAGQDGGVSESVIAEVLDRTPPRAPRLGRSGEIRSGGAPRDLRGRHHRRNDVTPPDSPTARGERSAGHDGRPRLPAPDRGHAAALHLEIGSGVG